MGKVKVGDKFKILDNAYFEKGEVVTLIRFESDGQHLYSNGEDEWYLLDRRVERLKFQVGDVVEFLPTERSEEYYGITSGMLSIKHRVLTISKITKGFHGLEIKVEENTYSYHPDWLKLIEDKDKDNKYPELKVGQVVEMYDYSENKEYLAMITHAKGMFEDGTGEPIIALTSKHTWFPVEEFNDELKYENHEVRKLYGYASVRDSNKISTEDRKLLWERPSEVKEMTLQEVIDELGYEIKIKK